MGRKRVWADDKMRQAAFQLQQKHPEWTQQDIKDHLLKGKDITPTELKKTLNHTDSSKSTTTTNVNIVNPVIQDINEDTYKEYLIRVINNCETDIRICTEIRNYLDKKNILKPSSNDLPVDVDVSILDQEFKKFKQQGATIPGP